MCISIKGWCALPLDRSDVACSTARADFLPKILRKAAQKIGELSLNDHKYSVFLFSTEDDFKGERAAKWVLQLRPTMHSKGCAKCCAYLEFFVQDDEWVLHGMEVIQEFRDKKLAQGLLKCFLLYAEKKRYNVSTTARQRKVLLNKILQSMGFIPEKRKHLVYLAPKGFVEGKVAIYDPNKLIAPSKMKSQKLWMLTYKPKRNQKIYLHTRFILKCGWPEVRVLLGRVAARVSFS